MVLSVLYDARFVRSLYEIVVFVLDNVGEELELALIEHSKRYLT